MMMNLIHMPFPKKSASSVVAAPTKTAAAKPVANPFGDDDDAGGARDDEPDPFAIPKKSAVSSTSLPASTSKSPFDDDEEAEPAPFAIPKKSASSVVTAPAKTAAKPVANPFGDDDAGGGGGDDDDPFSIPRKRGASPFDEREPPKPAAVEKKAQPVAAVSGRTIPNFGDDDDDEPPAPAVQSKKSQLKGPFDDDDDNDEVDSIHDFANPYDEDDNDPSLSRRSSMIGSVKDDDSDDEKNKGKDKKDKKDKDKEKKDKKKDKDKEKDAKKSLRNAKAQAKPPPGPWTISLALDYQPDDDPITGKLILRVRTMKNFTGPMYLKRTHIYVKAYLLFASTPVKDSKRGTELQSRAEELEFNQDFEWKVESSTILKHDVLIGVWGHSAFGKKNVPLGEVVLNLKTARAESQHKIEEPKIWLTFKK